MGIDNKFSLWIKQLRLDNNMSQEELGKLVGISKVSVWQWENGINYPNNETLLKLADYFQVSTDYLLGKSDIRNINNENEDYRIAFDDIGKDYAELEDSEKDMIKTMIKAFKDKHQKK